MELLNWINSTSIDNEMELKRFLDYLEYELETRTNDLGRLHYERYCTKASIPEIGRLEAEKARIYQSNELFETVRKFLGNVEDPRLQRRLECWHEVLLMQKVEGDQEILQMYNELSDEIMMYRYKLSNNPEATIADVRHVLRTEQDRNLRKEAWESVEPLAVKLKDKMLAFVRLRNQRSRDVGYSSFVDLGLANQGTGLQLCIDLLKQLNKETHEEYMSLLSERAERFGLSEIEPWDLQFLLDGGIDIPEQYFPKKLLNDRLHNVSHLHGVPMDKLGIRPEYFDIPWNGVCMRVNHRKDARIICNPRDGYTYYHTMFHELGHGLHSVLGEQPEFVFLREPSPSLEGMAETLGYFTYYADWLRDAGVPEADLKSTVRAVLAPWFFYLRQRTAFALFGLELYMNPDQDLDALLGSIEAEVTGVRANSMARWTGNAWYVNGLSWHNYIIADMIASQIHDALRQKFGSVYGNKAAFNYLLDEYISLGHLVPWRQKLQNMSGSDLQVTSLINHIKGMAAGEGL